MRLNVARACLFGLGVVLMVVAGAGVASAGYTVPQAAPEIDGGSIAAGFAAASSAVLILRSRLRARK